MIDINAIVERVKTLLNIEDFLQDEMLNIIVSNVEKHLFLKVKRINKDLIEVPTELEFVVEEISIRRYNRIGSEGMKSELVEGHRVDFYELTADWTPYEEVINGYEDKDINTGRGKVMFI